MSPKTQPLMIDEELRARLERVATERGHSASALAGAVLRDFLDEDEEFAAMVQVGIDDVEAGRVVEYDQVKRKIEARLAGFASKK
jgi:predicted transcriptional regulator